MFSRAVLPEGASKIISLFHCVAQIFLLTLKRKTERQKDRQKERKKERKKERMKERKAVRNFVIFNCKKKIIIRK